MTKTKKDPPMIITKGSSFYRSLNEGYKEKSNTDSSKSVVEIRKTDRQDALQQAKDMATAAKEIEALKGLVPKSVIDQLKKRAGLTELDDDDEKEDSDDKSIDPMFMQLLKEERDPNVRRSLIMSYFNKQGKGTDYGQMMLMAQMFNPQSQTQSQDASLTTKLLDKFLDKMLDGKEPEEKVLEKFKTYKEIFGASGESAGLDKILEWKSKLISAGLAGEAGGMSPELELKLKELELNHEDKKVELELQRDKNKQYGEIMENGVAALLSALPALSGNQATEQRQQEQKTDVPVDDSIPVTCPNCKRSMNIPEPLNKREVKCSGRDCGMVFHVEGNGTATYDKNQLTSLIMEKQNGSTET